MQLHVNAPGHERERRDLQSRVRSLVVSFEVTAGDEHDRHNIAALKMQLAFHRRALRAARQLERRLNRSSMLYAVRIIQRTFRKLKEVIIRDVLNWLTMSVVVLAVQDSASGNAARRLQRMLRAKIQARAAMREAARLARANMLLKRAVKTNLGGNDVIRSVPWSTFAKIKATHPTDDKGGLSLYGGPPRLRTPRRPRTSQPAGASRTTVVPRAPRPPPDADVFEELDVHLRLLSESSYVPGCLSASGAASGVSQVEDLESSGYYARSSLLDDGGTSLCGWCGSPHDNGAALPSGSHYGAALPGGSTSQVQARSTSLVQDTSWGAGPRATEPYDHGGTWPHRGQPSARALAEREADAADAKARGRKLRLAPLEVVISLYHEGAGSAYKDDPALYDEAYFDTESYFGVGDALLAAQTGDPNASPMIAIPPTAAALPQLVSRHPAIRHEELTAMYSLSPMLSPRHRLARDLPSGGVSQACASPGLAAAPGAWSSSHAASSTRPHTHTHTCTHVHALYAASSTRPQPPPEGQGRGPRGRAHAHALYEGQGRGPRGSAMMGSAMMGSATGRAAGETRKGQEMRLQEQRRLRAQQADGVVVAAPPRRASSARAWLGSSTVSTESSTEGTTAAAPELTVPPEVLRSACGGHGSSNESSGYAGIGQQHPGAEPGAGQGAGMVHGFLSGGGDHPYYHHYTHILPPSNQRRPISDHHSHDHHSHQRRPISVRPRSTQLRRHGLSNPPVAGTATAARSYSQMRDRPSKPIRYRTIDYHGAGGGGSTDRHISPGRTTH